MAASNILDPPLFLKPGSAPDYLLLLPLLTTFNNLNILPRVSREKERENERKREREKEIERERERVDKERERRIGFF